jgi:pyruvate-formate lyase-activating enzyme
LHARDGGDHRCRICDEWLSTAAELLVAEMVIFETWYDDDDRCVEQFAGVHIMHLPCMIEVARVLRSTRVPVVVYQGAF